MNDRLLSADERELIYEGIKIDEVEGIDRDNLRTAILLGAEAQDAKTLKAVGEWLLKHPHAEGYFVSQKSLEALRSGRMPE